MRKAKTTITVEPEQMAAMKSLAQEWGINVSVLMRYALAEFLRRPAIIVPASATVSSAKRDRQAQEIG